MTDLLERIDGALLSHSLEQAMGSAEAREWVQARIDEDVARGRKPGTSVGHVRPMVSVRTHTWQADPAWDAEMWREGQQPRHMVYRWSAADAEPLSTWSGIDFAGRRPEKEDEEVPF